MRRFSELPVEEEAKLRVSHGEFLEALKRAGVPFSLGRPVEQVDTFYDYPDRRLTERGVALRIRRSGGDVVVTFKGPVSFEGGVKSRVELEGPPGSAEAARALEAAGLGPAPDPEGAIASAGLTPLVVVRKVRVPVSLGGLRSRAYLDTVDGLGEFVEIEGPADEVRDLLRRLGLEDRAVPQTYAEMLAKLRRR
ncbi:MAG: hypothetical protein DRO01_07245 [Thermoproteota archaeon]|nr:MAG: hypothetical protein DRO01_07245 [Candidatus Korarchaeota archaeon]